VLFDTNVVLDVLLNRRPHASAAVRLFDHVAGKTLEGILGATTVTTIHYLARKAVGTRKAAEHVGTLLGLFDVAAVTRPVLSGALAAGFPDFEDAVLHEAARLAGADGIVTRDPGGFRTTTLSVYTPEELLAVMEAGHGSEAGA
jgi:predicted nucleic acid-binding protein